MKKYVYSFGNGTADGDGKMKDTLGGKGAGLAEMCRAKLPVPPGFTISTEVCNIYFENNNTVPAESTRRCWTRSRRSKSAWARSWATSRTRCWSACAPAPSSPCRA
jgi:phosphoenolpyruvate synthase/pyruvate phosphate dikinase